MLPEPVEGPSSSFWRVTRPKAWPTLPAQLSFSVLREIETCPLRWGLRRATFPDLWQGQGYPPGAGIARLVGQIIHQAAEAVLMEAGRGDRVESTLTPALRRLGGLSSVLETAIEAVLNGFDGNPRVRNRILELSALLNNEVAKMRPKLQSLLGPLPRGIKRTNAESPNRI